MLKCVSALGLCPGFRASLAGPPRIRRAENGRTQAYTQGFPSSAVSLRPSPCTGGFRAHASGVRALGSSKILYRWALGVLPAVGELRPAALPLRWCKRWGTRVRVG